MRIPSIPLVLLLTLTGLLAACGQKGPLYLPQQPAQPGTATAPTAPVAAGSSATVPGEQTDEQDKKEQTPQNTEAEAVSK